MCVDMFDVWMQVITNDLLSLSDVDNYFIMDGDNRFGVTVVTV